MGQHHDDISYRFWTLLATVVGILPGRRASAGRDLERLCLDALPEMIRDELGRHPLPTGGLYELPDNVLQVALAVVIEEGRARLKRFRLDDLRAGDSASQLFHEKVRWAVSKWTQHQDGDAFHGYCVAGRGRQQAAPPPGSPNLLGGAPHPRGQFTKRRVILTPAAGDQTLHLPGSPDGATDLDRVEMSLQWQRASGAGYEAQGEDEFWAVTVFIPSRRTDPRAGNAEADLRALSGKAVRLECYVSGREQPECVLTRLEFDPGRNLVSMARVCHYATPETIQAVTLTLVENDGPPG